MKVNSNRVAGITGKIALIADQVALFDWEIISSRWKLI